MKPNVLIAEDHELVLEGFKRILQDECNILGTAANGRELVSAAEVLKPDIILLDITMPLLNGIEAARQIRAKDPNPKFIFVTVQSSREYIREAFESGASGYVLKQAAASELVAAIRQVYQGGYYLSPSASDRFLGFQPSLDENPSRLFRTLTPRQREVLQLVAEGKSAKQIASLLYISVKTVEFHKKRLMEELRLSGTAELVRYAIEHGWIAR